MLVKDYVSLLDTAPGISNSLKKEKKLIPAQLTARPSKN